MVACCGGGVDGDGDDGSGWWMAGGCRVRGMRRYGNQQRASMLLEGDIIIPRPEAPAPESRTELMHGMMVGRVETRLVLLVCL